MKVKLIFMACAATVIGACSQKQAAVVTVPPSQIDVEKLMDSIDYNMDVSGLSIADVRTLRNAPAAKRGYPFKDSYLRGVYHTTTWYDSLMFALDENLPWDKFQNREDEPWRDFYYRVVDGQMKYSAEELDFMKRLKEREEELKKQNFDVPEGLRVNMGNLSNPTILKEFDEKLSSHLAQNGFGIVPATSDQLFHIYEKNDYNEFPNFVTTDLYLQLFHMYIDCTLRELETYSFLHLMAEFSNEMKEAMRKIYQHAEEGSAIERAAEHNVRFFTIADCLFSDMYFDPGNDELVAEEIENVKNAQDSKSRFMADYKEIPFAYSLFRPRGHYTRSNSLQEYFRGMMWLQSVPFGMDNDDEVNAAVIIAYAMMNNPGIQKKYDTLDRIITYLLGNHDNLSIPQVIAEVKKTGKPMEELLNDKQAMSTLKANLEKIGNEQTRIRPKYEKTSHNKICVMPQRYMPDAEVLQEMVDYDNKPTLRDVPKGIDIFAAMGVTAAEQILMDEKTDWKDLSTNLAKMKKRMSEIDWSETIANQWMSSLKAMSDKDKDQKLPYFMQNPEWSKKREVLEESHRTAQQHRETVEGTGYDDRKDQSGHSTYPRRGRVLAKSQREGVGRQGSY